MGKRFALANVDGRSVRYVAQSGSEHSYTRKLELAKRWATREAARAEACENEIVVDTWGE